MVTSNVRIEVTQGPFFHLYSNYALIACFEFIVEYMNM